MPESKNSRDRQGYTYSDFGNRANYLENDGDPFLRPGGIFGQLISMEKGLPPAEEQSADLGVEGQMMRLINSRGLLKRPDGRYTEIPLRWFDKKPMDSSYVKIGEHNGVPVFEYTEHDDSSDFNKKKFSNTK